MKSGDYDDIHRRMEGAINAFKHDIASLRTGRASSNLLDAVLVKAYGSDMPLNQVATVSVPEPRMISVSIRSSTAPICVFRCRNSTSSAARSWSRSRTVMPRTPASRFAMSAATAWTS